LPMSVQMLLDVRYDGFRPPDMFKYSSTLIF
jgi:hypothetical protein